MQQRLRLSIGAIVAATTFVSCGVPADAPPRAEVPRVLAVGTLANLRVIPKAPPAVAVLQAKRAAVPDQRVTFAFTGDTLTHSPVVSAARRPDGSYDFSPMFARVAPLISWADVAVCHLETPIAPPGQAISTFPSYGVPAEVTNGLAGAGYDRCSTASNHTIDRGVAGIDATVNALEAAGLGESGMARTPAEAVSKLFTVNGITVAHLSYTYGLNGMSLPRDEPWRSNIIDPQAIIAAAADARARGAQVVILSLHWGTEGASAPNDFQRSVAEAITASGQVDLVIGHHAHVIQPIEQVNGHWVVFGLGNFISNMPTGPKWPASTQDGVIVTVVITRAADGRITVEQPRAIPTWVDRDHGFVIRPVLSDLADPSTPEATKRQLQTSLERTSEVLGAYVAG